MFITKKLLGAGGNSYNRGIFGGGASGFSIYYNTMDYITISTLGDAVDFGDLTAARFAVAGTSNGSRGVFGGGQTTTSTRSNVINYITIATTGNATDFGDLTVARAGLAATSNGSRGVFGGGFTSNSTNVIDYITIATTGNAIDFGNLTESRHDVAATSNGSRGVFGGGQAGFFTSFRLNKIDYITIATTSNATDFGNLTAIKSQCAATSNGPRGVFGGGSGLSIFTPSLSAIDYITIATTGNATDFGDLLGSTTSMAATSNGSRGVFGGGDREDTDALRLINFITIATTGNATDFGDLTSPGRRGLGALSGFTGA